MALVVGGLYSTYSLSPSRVVGPLASVIPKMPTFSAAAEANTPFLPITVVTKLGSMSVRYISSQQMNSVLVDNWFSLPMKLPKPPKKSRSTKTGLFGRLDYTSKVSKVRDPLAKVGPVWVSYLTSPRTRPVTAR